MPSLMRSLTSSHVVGAVSDVHGVCGLLPSAGLVSSILLSSLFWSSASCAMLGRSKGPNPLLCVDTAPCRYGDRSCEASGYDGVCLLDTPPSALTACETDLYGYVSFVSGDLVCISCYGVLLVAIPISFVLGFATKAFGYWGSLPHCCAAPVVWLSPLPVYLDVVAMPDLLSDSSCCPVLLFLQPRCASTSTGRIPHPAQQPQQAAFFMCFRCILSGWNKDKTSQGKGLCECSLVRGLMYFHFPGLGRWRSDSSVLHELPTKSQAGQQPHAKRSPGSSH